MRAAAVTGNRADRELLFEALAVHLGLLSPRTLADLAEVRRDESSSPKARSVGQLLVNGSVLAVDQCAFLETVVDGLLGRNGGDLGRCLDSLSDLGWLRDQIERRQSRELHAPAPVAAKSSANPTLPSIPINGEHNRPDHGPGPDQWPDDDDSFHPHAFEVHGEGGSVDRPLKWSIGEGTSEGMRFRIIRPHAQGGIGKVSVAIDAELQREVALKQIKPERADDNDSRARFILEAEVTGRLEHPGIVPVYGLGIDDKGRPFYAMRFVRGISFEEAIARFHRADSEKRRDPGERTRSLRHLLDRFADVCQTIAYAHSRGVLHRDLKPANVLLGPFNESLVVDWGLAKILNRGPGEPAVKKPMPGTEPGRGPEPAAEVRPGQTAPREVREDRDGCEDGSSDEPPIGLSSSTDTQAGTSFGTPAYMSPEQAEGRVDQLGPASDVYSLGAMLYTMLSGRAPFEYIWCEVTALLDRVKLGEFPPPRKVNPRVPRALEAVCLKAMANRPEDRYTTAAALADDIERWLADEPVAAYREPLLPRLSRWARQHKPIMAGVAALLVTAVVALSMGVILVGREQNRTEKQRRRAIAKSDEATQKAEMLRRRDAVSRVNLAYREYLDDNVALGDDLLAGCPDDLRSWEWPYARRLGHSDLKTWTDSSRGLDVWCVAFAPDGTRIATGTGPWFQVGEDRTGELVVRDIRTGAEVFATRGLVGAVQAVAYSPDGRTIAAAHGFAGKGEGSVLMLLDADTGKPIWQEAETGTQILSLDFAPDGRTIATGCGRFNDSSSIGYARLRDAKTGDALGATISGAPGGVLGVAFAPDGRQLALASREVADLWDVSGPEPTIAHRLRGHVNFVYAVTFSPDGRRLGDRRLGQDHPDLGPSDRAAARHAHRTQGLRPRPGVLARRESARLGERGQERATLGPCRRRGECRVPRPYRLRPLRGVRAGRDPGRIRQPRRHREALAGGGARLAGDLPQQRRLGRYPGVRARRRTDRLGAQREYPDLGPAQRRGAATDPRPARPTRSHRHGVRARRRHARRRRARRIAQLLEYGELDPADHRGEQPGGDRRGILPRRLPAGDFPR